MGPWLRVPGQGVAMRQITSTSRATALTKTYPAGVFFLTAQNGKPLAPGQPSGPAMQRIFSQGLNQTGDPRASGNYWEVRTSDNALQAIYAAAQPGTVNIGGSVVQGNSSPWLLIAVVAVLGFLFFKIL